MKRLTSLTVVNRIRAGHILRIWWIHDGDDPDVTPNYVLHDEEDEYEEEVGELLIHSLVKRGLVYAVLSKRYNPYSDQHLVELTEKGEAWKT